MRSTNRLPLSLCLPKDFRRHNTARRNARSAALFVGSTPRIRTKLHKAASTAWICAGTSLWSCSTDTRCPQPVTALSALLFLYREVLALPVGWVDDVERAKKPQRLPLVFTREEARAVLSHLRYEVWLMTGLLYGLGLRLMECLRLRVKEMNLARLQFTVRDGKDGKDRVTVLPTSLPEPLQRQLERARVLHESDLREGFGRVYLP